MQANLLLGRQAYLSLCVTFAIWAPFTPLAAAQRHPTQEKVLHNFGKLGDGFNPNSSLVADSAGNLYGTTISGGVFDNGTAFEMTPQATGGWLEKVLYNFGSNSQDGINLWGNLILDKAGNLYGTTGAGGTYGYGTVFEISPASGGGWTETVLYSFNRTDGESPLSGLVFDQAGNLYGTTAGGGIDGKLICPYGGCGVVFKLQLQADGAWVETVLHNFDSVGTDGYTPLAGLTFDRAGNLYGTTQYGGTSGEGTVFELTPSGAGTWTEQLIHSFNSNLTDGYHPWSGLVFDSFGRIYGTTLDGGGLYDRGTVYQLTPEAGGVWTERILHGFYENGYAGYEPTGNVVFDAHHNLYGTTVFGGNGAYQLGTVYELEPVAGAWTETTLYNFDSQGTYLDGDYPNGGLIFGAAGNLYGTTQLGGNRNAGTVFEITP